MDLSGCFLLASISCLASFVVTVTCSESDTCSDLHIGELHDGCLAMYNLSSSFYHGVPSFLLEADINNLCSDYCTAREVTAVRSLHPRDERRFQNLVCKAENDRMKGHQKTFNASVSDPTITSHIGNLSACLDRNTAACNSLYHDATVYNGTFNLICNNKQLMMRSQLYCEPVSMFVECLKQHNEDIVYLQHYYSSSPTIPVRELCKAYSTARLCIHVNVTSSCTSEMSSFLTKLYRVRFLPSSCDMTSRVSPSSSSCSFGYLRHLTYMIILCSELTTWFTFSLL